MRWVPLRDLQEVVKFFTIVILTSLRNLNACKSSFFLEWCLWGNNRIIGAVYFYTTPVEIFPIFPLAFQSFVMFTWPFANCTQCVAEGSLPKGNTEQKLWFSHSLLVYGIRGFHSLSFRGNFERSSCATSFKKWSFTNHSYPFANALLF